MGPEQLALIEAFNPKSPLLLIEDELSISEIMGMVLLDSPIINPFDVHTIADPRDAYKFMEAPKFIPPVVITDLRLEGAAAGIESGLRLLSAMRAHPQLALSRIIICSGSANEGKSRSALEKHDIHSVISKPFNIDHLVDTTEKAVLAYISDPRLRAGE